MNINKNRPYYIHVAANLCSKIVAFIIVVVVVIHSWVVCSCWLISSSLVFILHIPQVKRSVSQIGPLKAWIVFCTLSFTVLSCSRSKNCSLLKTVITSELPLLLMASASTLPQGSFGRFYLERKPSCRVLHRILNGSTWPATQTTF